MIAAGAAPLPHARPPIIRKTPAELRVRPHFSDYEGERAAFSWAAVRRELAGLPGGGLNIAWAALDRHACGARCRAPRAPLTGARRAEPGPP